MTIAQKEYLKKKLNVLAIIAYVITVITLTAIGAPNGTWPMWVTLGMVGVPAVTIACASIYVPIATMVWHWRMMGECHTETESKILDRWWFFIVRSDSWVDYLTEEIEDYDVEPSVKQFYLDFLHRLENVEKPKLL